MSALCCVYEFEVIPVKPRHRFGNARGTWHYLALTITFVGAKKNAGKPLLAVSQCVW